MTKHVLFIGIGEEGLYENVGGSLDRHLRYTEKIGRCTMILINRKVNLHVKDCGNFTIYPLNSTNIILILLNSIIILSKIHKYNKIDIISTQDPFLSAIIGLYGKYILRIPLHIQNHSCFIDNKIWIRERPILFSILNFIAKINIKLADRLRVVNSVEKEIYIKKIGIKGEKIDIAPVPVDLEFYRMNINELEIEDFKLKYGLDKNRIILGWAGRYVQFKNLPLLFEITSKFKEQNISLLMAGNYRDSFYNLMDLETKYNIQPIYTGMLSKTEMSLFYKNIDIYLHTSDYEGYGLVVADALVNGVPVVSTNVAGSNDLIIHGCTGFIAKDEDEFYTYLKKLIENVELRNEMRDNSINFSNNELGKSIMEDKVISSILLTKKST